MSLTSELKDEDSPVLNFMWDYFPHAGEFVKSDEARLLKSRTIRPAGKVTVVPWNIIGRAIDYRIRYYFAVHAA